MAHHHIQRLLDLQNSAKASINELAEALQNQIDSLVDIKLMEIWFHDTETTDIGEIEDNVFETQMLYEELKQRDESIVLIQNRIEILTQEIENL